MTTLTKVLEQIGCQPLLRTRVFNNGGAALTQLGINEALSVALVNKHKQNILALTQIKAVKCCYIQLPSIINNVSTTVHKSAA